MTVIIAVRDGETCALAADSGIYDDDGGFILAGEKKIWRQGNALIGFAGITMYQEWAKASNSDDPYKIRDYIQEKIKDFSDKDQGHVIVATPTSIHVITGDGVIKRGLPYDAIGVPSIHAMGALAALADGDISPLEMVKKAIVATAKHNIYAQKPYVFLTTTKKENNA
jgi:ATP-dependent protease HslVU (ClpYQ) peptidase subunit